MQLGIGIIGCSGHYGTALQELAQRDDAFLGAVAFAHPTENSEKIRRHPAYSDRTKEYPSPEALLAEAELDGLVVNPPFGLIAKYNILAMRRGLPTYSEKPLATTFPDYRSLEEAAAATGSPLVAMYESRRHPVVAMAAHLVRNGEIGHPLLAFGQKSYILNPSSRPPWYKDPQLYGGTIPWVAIHAVDWVRHITGEQVKSVTANQYADTTGTFLPIEIAGTIQLEFAGKGSAIISFDYLRPMGAGSHGDDRFRIAGTEGVLSGILQQDALQVLRQGAGETNIECSPPSSLFADFLDALSGQGEMPMSNSDALASTAVALWAREAAVTKQRIELPSPI